MVNINKDLIDSGIRKISKMEKNSIYDNARKVKIYVETAIRNNDIITDLENFTGDDLENIKAQNRETILNTITLCAQSENMGKEIYLKKFIEYFLLDKTLNEEAQFETKLLYYIDRFKDDFYKSLKDSKSKLYDEIIEKFDNINYNKKKDLFFQLLFNSIILPEYKNQKQFNKLMEFLLIRFETKLNELLMESPISISEIVSKDVFLYMKEIEKYEIESSLLTEGIIDKISCYIDMQEMDPDIKEPIDEFSFTLSFKDNLDSHINQSTIKNYLDNVSNIHRVSDETYLLSSSAQLNFMIHIEEPIIDGGFIENGEIITHFIKISAIPKRAMKAKDFLSIACRELPLEVEDFTSMLYIAFGREYKRDGSHGEAIEGLYPTTPQIFDVMDHFNDEEGEKEGEEGKVLLSGISKKKEDSNIFTEVDVLKKLKEREKLIWDEKLEDVILPLIDEVVNREDYIADGIDDISGIAFYGEGGTGKSKACDEIVYKITEGLLEKGIKENEIVDNIRYLRVNIEGVFNMYVGESERKAKEIFIQIRDLLEKNKDLFLAVQLDEVDGLIQKDMPKNMSGVRSVLLKEASLLLEDYNRVIFLSTTNYIEDLSRPILRRLGQPLKIEKPNAKIRTDLLELNIGKYREDIFDDTLDVDYLVEKSNGEVHSFLNKWVLNTVKYRKYKKIDKITIAEFDKTFDRTKTDVQEENDKTMGFLN